MNHLIADELPATPSLPLSAGEGEGTVTRARISNSDPVTGQAGWYDVRVRIYPARTDEPQEVFPEFKTLPPVPGGRQRPGWLAYVAGKETSE